MTGLFGGAEPFKRQPRSKRPRRTFIVELSMDDAGRDDHGAEIVLRGILKQLLRRHGVKCESVRPKND